MPNIAAVLREEIIRLARREIRATMRPLKKRVIELTRTNASLRKTVPALEKAVAELEKEAETRRLHGVRAGAKELEGVRIGPRSIQAQRKRLKLTRAEFAQLAGVSENTIYLWETGQVSPKEKRRAVLVGLRKLAAKDARRLLEVASEAKPAKKGRSVRKARKRSRKKSKKK